MRPLSEQELLDLWERGRSRTQNERALLALSATQSVGEVERCAGLSIGQRDSAIMELQLIMFGPALGCFVVCQSCNERLEFELDIEQLKRAVPASIGGDYTARDGRRFRLPTTADLLAVADYPDVETAARMLLRRCCVTTNDNNEFSDELFAEVDAGLAQLDGFARSQIAFVCAACEAESDEWLDASDWLWQGIERSARQSLDDVHCLAEHYGWSEEDVLRLSPQRRGGYIERCRQ